MFNVLDAKKLTLAVPLVVGLLAMPASAQQRPGGGGGRPQRQGAFDQGPGRGRMGNDLKSQLGASDSEFAKLQPKIEQVMKLQREANIRPMGGPGGPGGPGGGLGGPDRFGARGNGVQGDLGAPGGSGANAGPGGAGGTGGRGGPGGPGGFGPDGGPGTDRPVSATEQIAGDLRMMLDNTELTDAEIKAGVEAVRAAKLKAKEDLAKAQQDLKAAVTVRQEAVLVAMGILE